MGYKGGENFSINHKNLIETHNSRGFKTPEFDIKKDPSTYRIIVLGGSSVYGFLLSNTQTWPYHLQNFLNEGNIKFEVINAGLSGYTTFHSLGLLNSMVFDLDPDLIILYQSWNDMKYFPVLNDSTFIEDTWLARTFAPFGNPKSTSEKHFIDLSYFITFLSAFNTKYITPIFEKQNNNTRERNFEKKDFENSSSRYYGLKNYTNNISAIAALSKINNTKLILSSQLTLYKKNNTFEENQKLWGNRAYYLNAFNQCDSILKLISEKNNHVFYFNPKNEINADNSIMMDSIHLTNKGSKLLSKSLSKYIYSNFGELNE